MRRAGTILACALVIPPLASAAPPEQRWHRVVLPPPILPRALSVDTFEFYLKASKTTVAAGGVRFNVYNRGEDDHDLAIVTRDGVVHRVDVLVEESALLTVSLTPGTYKVYCSLFAGTPSSHEDLGMRFLLRVR